MGKISVLVLVILFLSSIFVIASGMDTSEQDISLNVEEMAVVNVNCGDVTLTLTTPTTAGEIPDVVTDDSSTISYTNIADGNRKISARLDDILGLPKGTKLSLQAIINGNEELGTATYITELGSTDMDIIVNIGNIATNGNEPILKYYFEATDLSELEPANNQVKVIFTLSD